jgi:subtilisin family serine protease
MRDRSELLVWVRMYDGTSPPSAKVTLHPEGGGQPKKLKYDSNAGFYFSKGQPPGEYGLRVAAPKLEREERRVFLDGGNQEEVFYLAPPGVPFFFRGNVRIPLKEFPGLVGVALTKRPTDAEEKQLESYANGLGFSSVVIPAPVRDDMARVFEGGPSLPPWPRDLEDHPLVRKAGPVLFLGRDSLTFLTNELVVKFGPRISNHESTAILGRFNLTKLRALPYAQNAFLVYREGQAALDLLDVTRQLLEIDGEPVVYAEPNVVTTAVDTQTPPLDSLYGIQWSMPLAGLDKAWAKLESLDATKAFGDPDVLIAILDRGIESHAVGPNLEPKHPDFFGNVSNGQKKTLQFYNFAEMRPGNDGTFLTKHGCWVSGVAAALANNITAPFLNVEGIAGAAANCRILSLMRASSMSDTRLADAYIWTAGFDPGWTIDGVDYLPGMVFPAPLVRGADVINNSFARAFFDPPPSVLADALNYITALGRGGKGCVMVFSAGNGPVEMTTQSPLAAHPKTIAVAASTYQDEWATYSNFSVHGLDVCAPSGVTPIDPAHGIATTAPVNNGTLNGAGLPDPNGSYIDDFGGTSAAAPMVSGLIALMLSVNPDLTWIQVRDILRQTAKKNLPPPAVSPPRPNPAWDVFKPGYNAYYGYGRIRAGKAVQRAEDFIGDVGSLADTWIKEHLADVGDVPSHPMYSEDVWVRNLDPVVDAPPFDHQAPIPGQFNWVHAIARNRGEQPSSDVYVRLLVTRWAGTQFVYPDDFEPVIDPSPFPLTPGQMTPRSYLIGEKRIPSIPAGSFARVFARWHPDLMPPPLTHINGVAYSWAHPCLLADVTPHDGPPTTGNRTADNNNICQRNLTTVDPSSQTLAPLLFVVGHKRNQRRHLELEIVRKSSSAKVRLFIDYVDPETTQAVHRSAISNPSAYPITPVSWLGRTVFALPTARRALAPILRESGQYQWIALGALGLGQLPTGKHVIDVVQRSPGGRQQGLLRFEVVKP